MNVSSVFSESVRAWVGVASREHVQIGLQGGFAQFCHGKRGPAGRPNRGDIVLYYSSQERYGESAVCQRFTAFGVVEDEEPTQVEQFPGFLPWRRSVRWLPMFEAPVRPLVDRLTFFDNKKSWGSKFRFGFLEIPRQDLLLLATELKVDLGSLA